MTVIAIVEAHLRGLDPVRHADAVANLERLLARLRALPQDTL